MSGLEAFLSGVEVPVDRIRLRGSGVEGISIAAAADGSAMFAGVVFDDPDGDFEVTGWEPFVVEETRCTEAPRLFTGYIGDRTYRRGPYRSGDSREIDTTILDQNILARMQRINGADSLRPEETDTERLAWLLGSGYIPLVSDLGLVNGAGRVFEATQFKNKLPSDVLDDLIGPRGQIWFIYWDQEAEALGLFYDDPAAITFTSPLRLSNVLSDVDDVECFAPDIDASSNITPEEVYSNIAYVYKGQRIYRSNPTTQATFFPPPIGHRDMVVENDRVGLTSTAIAFADRILAARSTEEQTIDLVVQLPADKVGLIQAGHRIQVRLSFVPGFETFTWTRVETLTAVHTESNRDYYDVGLKLSTRGKVGPGGSGGGSTDPYPHDPDTPDPVHWWSFAYTLIGDTLSWPLAVNGHSVDSRFFPGATTYNYEITIATQAHPGTYAPTIELTNADHSATRTILSLPSHGEGVTQTYTGSFDDANPIVAPISPDDYFMGGGVSDGDHSMTHTATVTGWIDPVGWVTGAEPNPPKPSSPVNGEVVVMDGPDGTTAWPYAAGSLKVFVDNTDQTAAVTETNPECGDFTLAFTPTPTEQVVVFYQGA